MSFSPRTVHAPSRLHFGMFSFGNPAVRQFGGAGVMVDAPGLRVTLRPAPALCANGPLAERALRFAESIQACGLLAEPPRCKVEVETDAVGHTGLGTGTALALAVARALIEQFGEQSGKKPGTLGHRAERREGAAIEQGGVGGNTPVDDRSAESLARCTGRATRSSVGTHGFDHGGLIVEAGKLPEQRIGPLVAHVALPQAWRWVLIQSPDEARIFGKRERQAFERAPPVPTARTDALLAEVFEVLIPAARQRDFAQFSESVFSFGRAAGECFASVQGGPYRSERLARLVTYVRSQGIRGVGQSSWGPTIWALLPCEASAQEFVDRLGPQFAGAPVRCTVTQTNVGGARVSFV